MTRKVGGTLGFEVRVNGKRLCVAGVGKAGVLTAIVSWVGGFPHSPRKGGRTRAGETDIHVGGLFNPEPGTNVHLNWANGRLKDGDTVTLRVVRGAVPDPPRSRTVDTAASIREHQRRYYLTLKRRFERKPGAAKTAPCALVRSKPRRKPRRA